MAGYQFVSVPKVDSNQGRPTGKAGYIVLVNAEDVKTFTPDDKGVRLTAFALQAGKKPIGLYATQSTIKPSASIEGDEDAKGYIHKVEFEHPGTDVEYDELMNAIANEKIIAIVMGCSSDDAKVLGTPCTPLQVSKDDSQDDKDAKKNSVELSSALRSGPIHRIAKNLIPVTDNADINLKLGLTAAGSGSGSSGL